MVYNKVQTHGSTQKQGQNRFYQEKKTLKETAVWGKKKWIDETNYEWLEEIWSIPYHTFAVVDSFMAWLVIELGLHCLLMMWPLIGAAWILNCSRLYSVQIQSNAAKLITLTLWAVQTDNDPKHTTKETQKLPKKCDVFKWPSQSLHLNLTKDAFQLLKTQSEHSKTAKQAAVKTWQSISYRETPFGEVCV